MPVGLQLAHAVSQRLSKYSEPASHHGPEIGQAGGGPLADETVKVMPGLPHSKLVSC